MLVGRDDGGIVASVLVGHDGHRGWVYYVAVDPDCRHRGYGRIIMDAAEHWLRARGIEKLQLMVRPDNGQVQAFYQSLGYVEQERIIYAKWLDGREPTP
jgi:ribosomal protein S18 acetylase RimI-like enzyme